MSNERLLVLALDAASPLLLRRWGLDGTLPNIGRLLREGMSGPTRSVEGFYHGATWASFTTACSPGRHGVYWIYQARPGAYDQLQLDATELSRRPALWDVLAGAGKRVAVMDVPFDVPRSGLHGTQVLEYGAHDRLFRYYTWPESLAGEIEREIGPHPSPANCDGVRRTAAACRRFTQQLTAGTEARSRLVRRVLAGESWDFAIHVFSETHCAGHQLWHLHDPTHPGFDPRLVARTGDAIREVYVAIDRAIGGILQECAGPGTIVFLVDLHGMSYMAGAGALLPDLLAALGFVTRVPDPPPPGLARRAIAPIWRAMPEGIRGALTPLKHAVLGPPPPPSAPGVVSPGYIPSASRCYWINLGLSVSGVRLNIAGREPEGVLHPRDVEAFSQELSRELLAVLDPETGRPLVEQLRWTRDLYAGEQVDQLPDLIVDWDLIPPVGSETVGTGAGALRRATSPRIGTVMRTNRYCRSGEHRNEGMFIAHGAGIAAATLGRVISNMDLAPTFARLLGTEMIDVDGRPIPELVQGRP